MKKMKKLRVVLSFLIIVFTTFSCIKTPNNLKEKNMNLMSFTYKNSINNNNKFS